MSGTIHTSASTWRQPTPTSASPQRQALIDEVATDLLSRDGAVDGEVHRTRYLPAERIYLAEADPVLRADAVIDNADFDLPRIR